MSKELAQTMGGKRYAWLLAIVAAFAVFAAVGTQWQPASADVTGTDYELTDDQGGTAAEVGDTVGFSLDITDGDATVGDLQVVIELDETVGNIENISSTGLPGSPDCTVADGIGTNNQLTCTWDGPLAAGHAGSLTFDATALGGNYVAEDTSVFANDTGSAQEPQEGTNSTADFDVASSNIGLEKDATPSAVDAGDTVVFTIDVTNVDDEDGTDELDATNVVITDALGDDFSEITNVDATGSPAYDCTVGEDGTTVTCEADTHAVGDEASISIFATIDEEFDGEQVCNIATASNDDGADAASGEEDACVTIVQEAANDFAEHEGLFHLDPWGDALWNDDGELERDDPNNVIGHGHLACLADPDGLVGIPDAINESSADFGFAAWRIQNLSGDTSVNGQQLTTVHLDEEGNAVAEEDETEENIYDCVRWYSTGAGEQEITIVDGSGQVIADFGGVQEPFEGASQVTDTPLVKEWNVLDPTAITNRGETEPNLDGTTVEVPATFNPNTQVYESANGAQFDEHVFGSHTSLGGEWEGLVDGALVTFTVSGQCGTATVDPEGDSTVEQTSETISSGESVTVTSAGVPINFDVNTGAADTDDECTNPDSTTVTISVDYPTEIGSIPQAAPEDEVITVDWMQPTTPTKDIFLAWAGQRVMLDHNWSVDAANESDYTDQCPYATDGEVEGDDAIYVKGGGPGNFVTGENTTFEGADAARTTVNEDCLTQVVYESEDQGEVNVELFIEGSAASKFAFVIYYMKLENIELDALDNGEDGIANSNHNESGADWTPGNPWDLEGSDVSSNVSEDVLVRARVKGWFTTSNPSGRDRGEDDENNILPADRWVMPDDWSRLTAGTSDADEAYDRRPDADLMFSPASGMYLANPLGTVFGVEGDEEEDTEIGRSFTGPYSLVDIPERNRGVAPAYPGISDADNDFRDTSLGDGQVDWWDAPMPAAEVTFSANGSGFIKEVLKKDVYYEGEAEGDQVYTNPYYYTHIPGHPDIPAAAAGGGYEWNTWGGDGPYEFWNAVDVNDGDITGDDADELDDIRDAYGDDTIGREISVYSDNHGEAFVAANGDFNLSYADCDTNLLGGGQHCDQGDVVGETEIDALADYPDFVGNHFPVGAAETATIEWTWGGYKEVTVEEGETEQFVYVVFRALDRDGFCNVPENATSLHPVLSSADAENEVGSHDPVENIDFLIDSDEGGVFINTSGGSLGSDNKFASGLDTYSTADEDRSEDATDASRSFAPLNDGAEECQAWVKISNSLLGVTNVITVAHDDEGDIGFDNIVDFQDEHEYTLNFRWSLITWMGADGISPSDAISGEGENDGGDDISDQVTAIYGWQADSQDWLAYFPSGADIPGANDLAELEEGDAYWIAIEGPEAITWTVMTDVD